MGNYLSHNAVLEYPTGGKGSILHLKQDDNVLRMEQQKDTVWHLIIYFQQLIHFFFMHIFSGLKIHFHL